MSKNKKTFTIFGLTAAMIVLVGAIFVLSQPPKQSDLELLPNDAAGSVVAADIDGGSGTKDPVIKPEPIPASDKTDTGQIGSNIPLTTIADKPEPPELPETALTGELIKNADPEEAEAIDPALRNPDVKPGTAPAPVEPTKPKDNTLQSGDKNDKGEVFIPGFGWVKDEGGGGQGQPSGSDGDWNKIIGH